LILKSDRARPACKHRGRGAPQYPQLTVTSDYPPGEPNSYALDIKGGTKAERDEAMAYARKYAEGRQHKPTK